MTTEGGLMAGTSGTGDRARVGSEPLDTRHDERRVAALRRVRLLDTPTDDAFDEVVRFAADALRTPMAAISLIDADRQWYKSSVGIDATETPRDIAFCDHVVRSDAPLLVHDTLADARFAASPLVHGHQRVRSYLGVPIHAFGEAIGALCVLDHRPRGFGEEDMRTMRFLAHQVEHLVDLVSRRSSATPPARQMVVDLAARLSAGEPFDTVTAALDRPAWIYDVSTLGIVAVNPIAVDHYGWTQDEFARRSILDLRPPADQRLLAAAIDNSQIDRYSATRVWRHLRADGQAIDVRISSAAATHLGRQVRLVLVTDVTERLVLDDAIDRAGRLDSITGLPNRRELLDVLGRRLEHDPGTTAVLCIDLDRFKLVNDTLGHDAADVLLGAAAARVRQCTPSDDVVARIGGDSFAVVRSACTLDAAWVLGEEIRLALERPFLIEGAVHYVSASVGVAMSSDGCNASGLVEEAGAALGAAKAGGRNAVVVFDDALRRSITESVEVQREIQNAIERHEFELDVQPIVNLATGTLAYEALARWGHPTRGRLMPGTFIGVAEESGLIRSLGDQLLELGARHAAALDAPVSVNVSARQFDRSLVHRVAALIDDHHLAPGQLVIEVTESAMVDDDHAAIVLSGLRAAGADIWIDDFGTGYSSLGRLASLTVDALKLPREFIADLDTPHGWGIASAIVALARALDIDVIAEGVETERQLEQVRELGCDAAQGYHLGRPRPFAGELADRRGRPLSDVV